MLYFRRVFARRPSIYTYINTYVGTFMDTYSHTYKRSRDVCGLVYLFTEDQLFTSRPRYHTLCHLFPLFGVRLPPLRTLLRGFSLQFSKFFFSLSFTSRSSARQIHFLAPRIPPSRQLRLACFPWCSFFRMFLFYFQSFSFPLFTFPRFSLLYSKGFSKLHLRSAARQSHCLTVCNPLIHYPCSFHFSTCLHFFFSNVFFPFAAFPPDFLFHFQRIFLSSTFNQ